MYKPLNIPLEEFLRPFFDPGEKVCIRIFDDRKTGTFKGAKLETSIAEISTLEPMLHKHNQQNRGIYFVVNYGGNEDCDITRINAQYMECDDLSLEDQLAQIEAFPLQPSLIVKTRKSLHTYWLMNQRDTGPNYGVTAFRRIQKKLIAQFKGDKACVNESRVLRLPGFLHCKQEPVMVECIKFSPELRYTQAELEAVLPVIKGGQAIGKPAAGTRHGLTLVRRCEFMKHCADHASSLSEHDWYAMITNLAVFEGGDKAIHTLSAKYPGYNAAETQGKIEHFLASGTKPMTCRTIAEKGFTCPKINNAACDCKAPAALCYKPLTVEELRMFLKDAPVSKSAVENIQAAQEFTHSCLYNVDPVIAATFIEHEMKEYFGLKSGDMKPLSSEQRELCKTHKSSKETRRETAGDEFPEWYEMTDRGGLRFIPGLLADHLTSNVDAFYGAGSYFFYQNGVYGESEDLWASAKVREFMIPRYTTMNAINDAVGQWRMLIRKPVREINCNAFMINVKNGLYNILDDSFRPHTPEYYSTVQINATHDPGAKCPQFLAFLKSLLQEEEIHLMQEIFGYFLIPVNKAQKSFVFVGAPNAGKSTLLSVVQEILLGSENVSNIPWQNLADRFNKAELFGKLANIFADLPSKSIDDNGMFKALTGEDYITAERKNKDPFSFRPYARLLFSCNEIPRNYGDRSDGFYRRLVIIRFDKPVPANKRDPNLRERLAAERDGILMWALTGLKRLIANSYQFTETDTTRAELRRYRIESNSVLSFVDEFCRIEEGKITLRDELFMHYREYCHNAGMKSVSQGSFNKDIETNNLDVKRGRERLSRRHVWNGIQYCEGGKDTE
jgi:putative DNA primase/helicase